MQFNWNQNNCCTFPAASLSCIRMQVELHVCVRFRANRRGTIANITHPFNGILSANRLSYVCSASKNLFRIQSAQRSIETAIRQRARKMFGMQLGRTLTNSQNDAGFYNKSLSMAFHNCNFHNAHLSRTSAWTMHRIRHSCEQLWLRFTLSRSHWTRHGAIVGCHACSFFGKFSTHGLKCAHMSDSIFNFSLE